VEATSEHPPGLYFFKSTRRSPNPRLFFLITKTPVPEHLFPYNHPPFFLRKYTLLATPHQSTALPPNPRRLPQLALRPSKMAPEPTPDHPEHKKKVNLAYVGYLAMHLRLDVRWSANFDTAMSPVLNAKMRMTPRPPSSRRRRSPTS
jgi:hypothetical protein